MMPDFDFFENGLSKLPNFSIMLYIIVVFCFYCMVIRHASVCTVTHTETQNRHNFRFMKLKCFCLESATS